MGDKTIIVTGGSRGLGRATASIIAHMGANVVLAARSAQRSRLKNRLSQPLLSDLVEWILTYRPHSVLEVLMQWIVRFSINIQLASCCLPKCRGVRLQHWCCMRLTTGVVSLYRMMMMTCRRWSISIGREWG